MKALKNIKTLGLAAALMLLADKANAADDSVFGTVMEKGVDLFEDVRDVIFILGGFGLVGLAVGAIFGKVNWKWFGSLAFGLTVLAVASAAITYLTGSDAATMTDTL